MVRINCCIQPFHTHPPNKRMHKVLWSSLDFVPHFSVLLWPIYQVPRKVAGAEWGPEQAEALQQPRLCAGCSTSWTMWPIRCCVLPVPVTDTDAVCNDCHVLILKEINTWNHSSLSIIFLVGFGSLLYQIKDLQIAIFFKWWMDIGCYQTFFSASI